MTQHTAHSQTKLSDSTEPYGLGIGSPAMQACHAPRSVPQACNEAWAHMDDASGHGDRPLVLIVEDEPMLRSYAAAVIEEAGFDTVEASNADGAIAILEARKDIRIVFTDIEMPGSMDGLRLARAIRDRWPPIELVLASGKHHPAADQIPERGQFVPKPYTRHALVAALNGCADCSLRCS